MHLMDLNNKIRQGVEKAGLIGMQFNTIGVRYTSSLGGHGGEVLTWSVSDGISMGTDGMRYSLQSRDLIADSIEVRLVSPCHFSLRRTEDSDGVLGCL